MLRRGAKWSSSDRKISIQVGCSAPMTDGSANDACWSLQVCEGALTITVERRLRCCWGRMAPTRYFERIGSSSSRLYRVGHSRSITTRCPPPCRRERRVTCALRRCVKLAVFATTRDIDPAEAKLWREDIRDLISLSEYKMHVYLLVNVLLLGRGGVVWSSVSRGLVVSHSWRLVSWCQTPLCRCAQEGSERTGLPLSCISKGG